VDLLISKNVQVPMRDGVQLATDVYRPAADGRYPTIVNRLPYDKELPIVNFSFDVLRAARAGYAVAVQDTRGRYQSEGSFVPFAHEAADGADTIAWAAAQSWSTGEVGMVGGSYFGATQWLAATQSPPALRAIAPFVTTDQYYESWAYQGGAFQLGFNLHWCLLSLGLGELLRQITAGSAKPERLAELIEAIDDNDALYRRLPLVDVPELAGLADYYQDWLAHPAYDDYWQAVAPRESWSRITVPALNMGGWYDLFLKGTIANYLGMKEHGGSEQARGLQRLVIGPWAHGPLSGWYPQRNFGFLSGTDAHDITGMQLRWFDQHLCGEDEGLDGDKPVQIFVMGADEWRDEVDWPLPGTEYVD
jgi:putative CocE/NonD family hydrolase